MTKDYQQAWVKVVGSGLPDIDPFRIAGSEKFAHDIAFDNALPCLLDSRLPRRWSADGDGQTPYDDPSPHHGDPAAISLCADTGTPPCALVSIHKDDMKRAETVMPGKVPAELKLLVHICRAKKSAGYMTDEEADEVDVKIGQGGKMMSEAARERLLSHAILRGYKVDRITQAKRKELAIV